MEVLYRSNYEGGATCTAYMEDGYDAGPTLFREDPDAPGFYLTFQNPMWHEVKPQIIQFSDFLNWYEPIDYKATLNWLLYKKEVGVGRFSQYRHTGIVYMVTDVRIKSTYMTRIDETSFCHDVIVIADLVAHLVGRSRPVTEWYRFRTIRTLQNCLQGELEVTIYNPDDAVKGRPLLDSLAPDIPYHQMDAAAIEMLAKYDDRVLHTPGKTDPYRLAANMGYTVQEAFLSEDHRIRGRVVFEEMKIMIFDPETGTMVPRTIKAKTILIDPIANKGRWYDFTADTIIHECLHIYWHQLFMKMQMLHWERMEFAGLVSDLETILLENREQEELHIIERQARAMTPRVRMPAGQTYLLCQQYLYQNSQKYSNYGMAVEKTIGQLASFFGESKETTRNRMKELGCQDVNGVLVYCNGRYLPRHSWSTPLRHGESYSIDSRLLDELRNREPVLQRLLAYEAFVYADGFVCLNDPRYVINGKCGRQLTSRALKDVSRCCLRFTIHQEYDESEYTYGVLNNIDKRKMETASLSREELNRVMNEALVNYDLPLKIREDFFHTIEKHKQELGMSESQFADVTLIDADRLRDIQRGKVKNPTVGEVVAMGLGLGMQPEEIIDLVDKSPAKWDYSFYHTLIKTLLRVMYQETVAAFNATLIELGEEPLVKEKPKRHSRKANDAA